MAAGIAETGLAVSRTARPAQRARPLQLVRPAEPDRTAPPDRPAQPDRTAPLGVLTDGTPYFAPVGEVTLDGDLVLCHLCGRWRRSVTAHLRAHGWTKEGYCVAFGLERGQSLEGTATRKMRAASFSARLLFDPAVRAGSARGRARAGTGELAQDAAAAARGRPLPEQRRRRARTALAGRAHPGSAEASRERALTHLRAVGARVAAENGFADIGALVRARTAAGDSLAAISRAAGLHKDWLSRHLAELDPVAAADAAAVRAATRTADDRRWTAAARAAGFADVGAYLRQRHTGQHWSVNQIAAEAGLSYHAVAAAMARHGMPRIVHAATRHAATERAAQVAAGLGFPDVASYVRARRGDGWTWQAMADEAGQPQSWLRRHSREG
jgi:lambda repressor-like predicted transcriptional regulator